jgi:hypothetical protein
MIDLDRLKSEIGITDAWHRLGLEGHPQPGKCLSSPFRVDRNPSFSISRDDKRFKDFATGENGDVLAFVMKATGRDFKGALEALGGGVGAITHTVVKKPLQAKPEAPEKPFRLPAIDAGTIEELRTVQHQRKLDIWGGLQILIDRGHFGFCQYGGHRCWIVFDRAGKVAQVRRLDGQKFFNGGKGITLAGSNAKWPIGASTLAGKQRVFIAEGATDLLAASTLHACTIDDWATVGMLGASMAIHEDALQNFTGRDVTIYADNDQAGRIGRREHGATS